MSRELKVGANVCCPSCAYVHFDFSVPLVMSFKGGESKLICRECGSEYDTAQDVIVDWQSKAKDLMETIESLQGV